MLAAATRLILYAPSIRTGGGLVLLQALLECERRPPTLLFGDARAVQRFVGLPRLDVKSVGATVPARLSAQRTLRAAARVGDTVLCLQGMPPLLPLAARVVVFQQNRLVPEGVTSAAYPLRTRVQVALDRVLGRWLQRRVSIWYVQTPSMRRAMHAWLGDVADVRVLPFAADVSSGLSSTPFAANARWDFVYVSDGVAHKNHLRLVDAWRELAGGGLRPSLALTLGERDASLAAAIDRIASRDGLQIVNLGHLAHDRIVGLYRDARALVFPSLIESYGLPLVEAAACGLPIVAAERDYVRDVCVPAQTFDPLSSVSIARAVRRFLGEDDVPCAPCSAAAFLLEVLR